MSNLRPNLVPIGDIVAALNDRIEDLCRRLLPGGKRNGGEWIFAGKDSCLGCSGQVRLVAPRRGVWIVWANRQGGDALDLVAELECHGDKSAAVRWALDWLGGTPVPDNPQEREARERREQWAAKDAQRRKSANALRIWLSAQPELRGTPAERYLRNRGIDLAELGRQPRALRFHPALYDDGQSGSHWPALVAGINRPDGMAVHRIWLTPQGTKAPIAEPKRTLGPKSGGIIPLWRGAGNKPLRAAAPGSTVWISEGIEDGLSIAILTGGKGRVVAAIDLGNMSSLALPPAIETVVIVGQNDQWWHERQQRVHGAALGLDRAIRHFQSEGRQVRVWRPDRPDCKDANDLLRALREHGRVA